MKLYKFAPNPPSRFQQIGLVAMLLVLTNACNKTIKSHHIKQNTNNHITIPVVYYFNNKKITAQTLIDTGSSHSIINEAIIEKEFTNIVTNEIEIEDSNENINKLKEFKCVKISLEWSNQLIRDHLFFVTNLNSLSRSDSKTNVIIGNDILSNSCITIDTKNNKFYFGKLQKSTWKIPLVKRGNMYFFEAKLNNKNIEFGLDTGLACSVKLNNSFKHYLHASQQPKSIEYATHNGIKYLSQIFSKNIITINEYQIDDIDVDLSQDKQNKSKNNIATVGISVFRNHIICMDFLNYELSGLNLN